MQIDAHQHFWRYDPAEYGWISEAMPALRRDRLPVDLEGPLRAASFDGCVAVQARQTEAETEFLLGLADQHDFIRGVVGWIDLQAANVRDRLTHFARFPALRGIRHIVQDEPDDRFLLRPRFVEGVRQLADFGLRYDILVYERHLPVVVEFLEQFDERHSFVLDHIGKPEVPTGLSNRWRAGIRAIAAHPNVYCKLSGLVTEADWRNWRAADFYPFLEVVFDAFGPHRLMIGSDWPVCLLAAGSYAEVIDVVGGFLKEVSPDERAAIFGNNAVRFYGLQEKN